MAYRRLLQTRLGYQTSPEVVAGELGEGRGDDAVVEFEGTAILRVSARGYGWENGSST